jgi:hypothetical protein
MKDERYRLRPLSLLFLSLTVSEIKEGEIAENPNFDFFFVSHPILMGIFSL